MCGIAGFVGEGTLADIERMNRAQSSRGPDGEGVWNDEALGLYLGHSRLAIIDPEDGRQPMWTPDGKIGVVFNGEIYNFAELREELTKEGAVFQTDHSDTETLLYAYRIWGNDFVNRLNGMWAFVIYDAEKKRLFASRDRFGKKPFYYTAKNNLFAFASELSSLTAHERIRPSLSKIGLIKYYAYGYIPAPNSIYEGVRKLPGGWNLEYNLIDNSLRVWRYWEFVLEPAESLPENPEETWGEELRELLRRASERRLVSDVPIGAFLSGGIDSSAVSYYAARKLGENQLHTYSIAFEEASFDESSYARFAANYVKSVHHECLMSMESASDLLPEALSRLDEPMGDASILPTYMLCGFAREQVTVALGGDGADELFAGYDPFKALQLARVYETMMPRPLHRAISLLVSRLPVSHRNMSLDFKLKRTLNGLGYSGAPRFPVWMAPLSPDDWESCFQEKVSVEEAYSEAIQYYDDCRQKDPVNKMLQFFTKLYLQDDILTKVDRASMMHSLEVRAPFLDIELVDFVRKIPAAFKFRRGQTKYLLKKALEPVLPRDILYRKKKGFGVPTGKWFQSKKIQIRDMQREHLNADFVRSREEEHVSGKADHRLFLWNTLVYEEFLKNRTAKKQPALKGKAS